MLNKTENPLNSHVEKETLIKQNFNKEIRRTFKNKHMSQISSFRRC